MIDRTANHTELTALLPKSVVDVFNHYLTAELTTLGRSGVPITWPIMPIFWAERNLFVTLTSIGLPQKAINLRRNPQTSLLFSDPTGSNLENPPIVLVQGQAEVGEKIMVTREDAGPELFEVILFQARKMVQKQPAMSLYMRNPLTRYLMDWYFMRLLITIEPRNILWWQDRDYARPPQQLEVTHVA